MQMDFTQFEDHLIRLGRRERTAKRHIETLNLLMREEPELLTDHEKVEQLILRLKRKGLQSNTLNAYISTLNAFSLYSNSALGHFKHFPKQKTTKQRFADSEIVKILTLPPLPKGQSKEDFARWTLFYKIMAFSGMRPGEVASLTIDRVDFGNNVFVIPADINKTKEPKYPPIHTILKSDLYAENLEEYVKRIPGPYLFPSKLGGAGRWGVDGPAIVGAGDWNYNLRKRCERLGIRRKSLTTHSFRHTVISALLGEDVSLPKVQQLVGHTRIETTAGYTHLPNRESQRTIERLPYGLQSVEITETIRSIVRILQPYLNDERLTYQISEESVFIGVKKPKEGFF